MSHSLVLQAFGRTVELIGSRDVLALAASRLPPAFERASAPPERRWEVRVGENGAWLVLIDGDGRPGWGGVEDAVEATLSDVELWVAEHARNAVFVHAGCVVLDGRAIILPGFTRSGKTRLTKALVDAGAVYYSDEFAVLDAGGVVTPYPRPLSLRLDSGAVERLAVDAANGTALTVPAPVALVALLRHHDDNWMVEPLSKSRTVFELLKHTVPAQSRPHEALAAITAAARGAMGIMGTRGDADEAAVRLIELLRR